MYYLLFKLLIYLFIIDTRHGVFSTGRAAVEGHAPAKVTILCSVGQYVVSSADDGSVHVYEFPIGRLVSRFGISLFYFIFYI